MRHFTGLVMNQELSELPQEKSLFMLLSFNPKLSQIIMSNEEKHVFIMQNNVIKTMQYYTGTKQDFSLKF